MKLPTYICNMIYTPPFQPLSETEQTKLLCGNSRVRKTEQHRVLSRLGIDHTGRLTAYESYVKHVSNATKMDEGDVMEELGLLCESNEMFKNFYTTLL